MHFQLGVIEGFYGRQWSWAQREQLPALLAAWGYNAYIYAPKGDSSLRSAWHQPFSRVHQYQLSAMSEACHQAGIAWGLGFSPAGLQTRFDAADRQRLAAKVDTLKALVLDQLWILFDDLPAGNPDLARRQLDVVDFIRQQMPNTQLAVCPSYYSEDPILEQLFGACPTGYFEELGAGLAEDIDILWTGRAVISPDYSAEDMDRARLILGRKPLLWDNYPVNDGRKSSRFLNLYPFRGRGASLAAQTRGHFTNPMNQFAASCLVLPTLAAIYKNDEPYWADQQFEQQLSTLPEVLAQRLRVDWSLFQEQGLDQIPESDKNKLCSAYRAISHPIAVEVADWLDEAYRFDPDCLTE
ncbi:beta-N-acetylglucosaminidase domain-containing protein [Spongiibacter sp. KMU-158]|uniref:Beta-N-acetylglucosaminidase domain-containing protein n=1 Tax=Spongiibacter pelagi TaxID=2760804 RepID=A0A927C4E8_9GAMM|nr:beta-N-acetylglucosaminidase domain-containing protein [Spongiibacter pelagi]MBD2859677.1 beta-N-acetylglucosaminidase domain-containing protein [Spongiibacter pelagi]